MRYDRGLIGDEHIGRGEMLVEGCANHGGVGAGKRDLQGALFSAKAGAAVGETLSDVASDGRWDDDERRADLVGWLKVQSIVNGIVDGIEESLKAKAS